MENKKTDSKKEEEIVTISEYLERKILEEKEAKEILSGNITTCTYHSGHLNQPIFVCLTCEEDDSRTIKEKAGMCYSCSISCHASHQLLELFNKRGFRCECGTHKFPNKCQLEKMDSTISEGNKFEQNGIDKDGWRKKVENNKYSENFDSIYCWCKKDYNPETETDDMYQCCDCQDWFHKKCIGVSEIEEDDEFICFNCSSKHPVLFSYLKTRKICLYPVNPQFIENPETKAILDTITEPKALEEINAANTAQDNKDENYETAKGESDNKDEEDIDKNEVTSDIKEIRLKRNRNEDNAVSNVNTLENETSKELDQTNSKQRTKLRKTDNSEVTSTNCKKPDAAIQIEKANIFIKGGWREVLCKCEKCLNLYSEQDMEHLIEPEEEYDPYDEEESENDETIYDAGMKALEELPRPQAISIANSYNKIRDKIREFIAPFAQSGKVVTKEDVLAFLGKKE